jgi:hypothetical protein
MDKRKAYRPLTQDTSGYKTFVDTDSQKGILPSQQESKTDTNQDSSAWPVQPGTSREKERALPLPSGHPKTRDKKVGPTQYNKSQQTPYRTKSVPGDQYGHPTKYDYNMPTRRPGVTSSEVEAANPLPKKRQNKLPPAYQRVTRNEYLRNPSKKREQKLKYKTKLKHDPKQKQYQKYYRQYPERFERRGLSPYNTPAERTKAWREEQKEDARRKGITPKEQEHRRKENPKKPRSRKPKQPGSTSRTYSLTDWVLLASDWPSNWTTQVKKTEPPEQLDQNYGKGRSQNTGTPRKDPSKQEGESLRAPNLDRKNQPGLLTQHKPPAAGAPNTPTTNNPTSGSGKVIPMSYYTDIVNNTQQVPSGRQDRYVRNDNFQVKQAATVKDILARVSPEIRAQARERVPQLLRTDTKNWIWHWKSGNWEVKVQAFEKGASKNLKSLNLRVSCSCPFWQWQGPEHWAKQGGYLLGKPRGTASQPQERDPKHVHPVCKHVYAVLEKSRNFFVRPEKSPLRKLGSMRVEYEDPTVDLVRRVAARYLGGED